VRAQDSSVNARQCILLGIVAVVVVVMVAVHDLQPFGIKKVRGQSA